MTRWLILMVALLMLGASTPALADDWADCLQQADPELSTRACTEIINSGKETGENLAYAYANRGYAHGDKGDHDRAILDYDKAIQLKPDLAYDYYGRGVAHDGQSDLAQALSDYRDAARLISPSDPLNGRALARIAEIEKKFVTAPTVSRRPPPAKPSFVLGPGVTIGAPQEVEAPEPSVGAPEEAPGVQGVSTVQLPRLRPTSLRDLIEPTIHWK
jgi:tetratricopeptide (TPR) repeat protein